MSPRYSTPDTPGAIDESAVIIRRSGRARRMLLRVDTRTGAVVLTLPHRVSKAEGLAFVRQQESWIARARAALPAPARFVSDARIPLLGEDWTIRFEPALPRTPRLDTEQRAILIGGEEVEIANRLRRFLRAHAAAVITPRAKSLAARLNRDGIRVRIGDPQSRWGSCSTSGTLSFSWRLVMAPEWVIDYVIAHEVAHLREMNHSPRFWRLVNGFTERTEQARAWLRHYGPALQRVG